MLIFLCNNIGESEFGTSSSPVHPENNSIPDDAMLPGKVPVTRSSPNQAVCFMCCVLILNICSSREFGLVSIFIIGLCLR